MTGGHIQFLVLPHMLSVIGCLSDLFFFSCSNRDFSINVEIQRNQTKSNSILWMITFSLTSCVTIL